MVRRPEAEAFFLSSVCNAWGGPSVDAAFLILVLSVVDVPSVVETRKVDVQNGDRYESKKRALHTLWYDIAGSPRDRCVRM